MTDSTDRLAETGHWRALLAGDDECCELLARLKEAYDRQHAEIERLRARILELEATHAMLVGTFRAAAVGELDEPAVITANHPPSAPPHLGHTIKWPPPIGKDDE